MIRASVNVQGIPGLVTAFEGVKNGVRSRVMKGAMRSLASVGNKRAKANLVRSRTKQLYRSLGIKFRSYKRGTIWVFVVGPRRGFKTKDKNGRNVNPVHYSHLVERPRREIRPKRTKVLADKNARVVYGKRVRATPGWPFLGPALRQVEAMAPTHLGSEVPRLLALEAARYASKGKSIKL